MTIVDMDMPGTEGYSARYFASTLEHCSLIATKPDENPPKYYIQNSVAVIDATERASQFVPNPSAGYRVDSVICGRREVVPAPNDYKVVVAGYPLIIFDAGPGQVGRRATLQATNGKFQFLLDKGPPLTDDLEARVNARLAAFQKYLPAKL